MRRASCVLLVVAVLCSLCGCRTEIGGGGGTIGGGSYAEEDVEYFPPPGDVPDPLEKPDESGAPLRSDPATLPR